MVTSAIMVNTSITRSSSLFVINKGVPGMGLGESSWEGTPYGWPTGSLAGVGPKNTRVNMGVLFIGFLLVTFNLFEMFDHMEIIQTNGI